MKFPIKLSVLLATAAVAVSLVSAQTSLFRARLSEVPVTPQTYRTITGVGEVFATLNGSTLSLTGTYEGMSSAATAAHVHNAPKAMNGPPIGAIEVTSAPSGEVSGSLELTPEQVTALRNEELYIVIHSENNPGGEIRGWLLPRES
ncbi:MAG: CHRD domain-containing protein [Gammaproteobacteria bacterium]|nr:CHRD domain-containing protein [Pseudomonadales bacterium]MCP5348258.1 CHRD domain-containing protein [Pseudomonadales bacterium]